VYNVVQCVVRGSTETDANTSVSLCVHPVKNNVCIFAVCRNSRLRMWSASVSNKSSVCLCKDANCYREVCTVFRRKVTTIFFRVSSSSSCVPVKTVFDVLLIEKWLTTAADAINREVADYCP